MSMGNYFSPQGEDRVMAVRHPPVGIAHLTVVPENFDPDRDDECSGPTEDA
ncbi:MAG: hypothetical protein ACI9CA_001768 [Natronomonas sp.]|jgi:hypothetical protein